MIKDMLTNLLVLLLLSFTTNSCNAPNNTSAEEYVNTDKLIKSDTILRPQLVLVCNEDA